MRKLILLFLIVLTSCGGVRDITPSSNMKLGSIPKLEEIQPDTCLTDKQLRDYYKFVEKMIKLESKQKNDSLKFELRRQKQQDKNEIDSLKVELRRHRSDNTVIKYEIKFDSRRFSDSLKTIRKMYSDSISLETKTLNNQLKIEKEETKRLRAELGLEKAKNKQENKTERKKLGRAQLFWWGVFTGVVLLSLLLVVWGAIKRYLKQWTFFT